MLTGEALDYNLTKLTFNHSLNNIVGGDSLVTRETLRLQREAEEKRKQVSYQKITTDNPYPYGWCTWYVAQQKGIHTSFGNAKEWPVNSQTPQVGAVMVTYESWRGHVAFVESVNGDQITVSEMNFGKGFSMFGKVSKRTVNIRLIPLKGFLI